MLRTLDEGRWDYDGSPEQGVSFPVDGDSESWTCVGFADDYAAYAGFCSQASFEIFTDRLEATAEYICRANWDLIVPCLELHWDEGAVRCRTASDFGVLDPDLLTNTPILGQMMDALLQSNLTAFERHLSGIRAVVVDGVTPEAALRQPGRARTWP